MNSYKRFFFIIFWLIFLLTVSISITFGQSNRLTNENGQLLWQYNQIVIQDKENPNIIKVSFVFINGINQTAISLRQEVFNSAIVWVDTANMQIGKEDRVEFITSNLAPHQSIVLKYNLSNIKIDKELLFEKSALLIMNEEFEIRKEKIPEQRFQNRNY